MLKCGVMGDVNYLSNVLFSFEALHHSHKKRVFKAWNKISTNQVD